LDDNMHMPFMSFHCQFMLAILLVLGISTAGLSATDLHIASSGSDNNPGTEAAPFASLAAARDAVRIADGAVTVWLHDGVYPFSESVLFAKKDSGTLKAPIHYRAKNLGKVKFSGGRTLESTSFTPVMTGVMTLDVRASRRLARDMLQWRRRQS
jgi:hypothetical protein